MEFIEFFEVVETRCLDEVNKLLKDGWIILSSGHVHVFNPEFGEHTYSLGLPQDVAASLNPKEYDDGINF